MCGIVGYIGNEQATSILTEGLENLEYRGYDSSGIAVMNNNCISVVKRSGRLDILKQALNDCCPMGKLGIGHTRWATHGEPSGINAHPHLSHLARVAIVHNGIIENHVEISHFLAEREIHCVSETDSETIAHLIEYFYHGDPIEALIRTANMLRGSYAIGVIITGHDRIYAMRSLSPLIVGLSSNGNYIASDLPAYSGRIDGYIIPEDGEIVELSRDSVKVLTKNRIVHAMPIRPIERTHEHREDSVYPHFMLKEIHEQPMVNSRLVHKYVGSRYIKLDNVISPSYARRIRRIRIVACGSAYNAGLLGKFYIEKYARLPVDVDIASEFRYASPIIDYDTLCIAISQSGETADTIGAATLAHSRCMLLAITNVIDSSLARSADYVIHTDAGNEVSVATTKGYTTQVSVLMAIALYMGALRGSIDYKTYSAAVAQLASIGDQINTILQDEQNIRAIAEKSAMSDRAFFIGRNADSAVAAEGALKLKEISYVLAESYAAGELKHGTISLITPGTPVIALSSSNAMHAKMTSNVREVRARGAVTLVIAPSSQAFDCDYRINLPESEFTAPVCEAVALQLLAYYIAAARGCDIDKPRNLAKSVTVE